MSEMIPVEIGSWEPAGTGLLVVGCFEGEAPELAGLDEGLRAAAERLAGRPGWSGREEQRGQTYVEERAVALHGLGKRRDFNLRKLQSWIADAADEARADGDGELALKLPRHAETSGIDAAGRVERLAALAGYRFDRYLSDPAASGRRSGRIGRITLLPPVGEEAAYAAALPVTRPVAEAVAFARDLGNAPSNEATPAWMEERARELAADRGLTFTVLGAEELAARGMGALLAVGAGSDSSPRMLKLAWGDSGPAVALVGKGVTFDSGGISIKSAGTMDEMKYDKCGACAVLGAARAVVDLGLDVRLRVYVPLAENVLDARSFRPGDIVRCYNGKTVETVNTDAEGRLILADAIAWAVEEGAEELLELSTLTGACVVALGHHAAGLFTPDDALAAELLAAAEASGERLWRLPMGSEYLEEMKGTHADLRNSATRWGAASHAAAFLSQFVGDLGRWAHVDTAGVSWVGRDQNSHPGATGFGVPFAVAWLRALVAQHRSGRTG